jgi:hypothetical protein
MKKIILGEPVVISQNTTEPIMHGAWQNPLIRYNDGVLYVRFKGVKDSYENQDEANKNPVFRSFDGGESWERMENVAKAWAMAQTPIANGDRVAFHPIDFITDTSAYPKPAPHRADKNILKGDVVGVYTDEEIREFVGDDLDFSLICHRIKAGSDEMVEHRCRVDWKGVKGYPLIYKGYVGISGYLCGEYRVDKDGTIYLPVSDIKLNPDGTLASKYQSMFFLKSTDNGYSFEYVGGLTYKDEYNPPNAIDVEGFLECCLEICDDGSFFAVLRSGSISPFTRGDDDHPAPKSYIAYSYDKGKSWTEPEIFYDYGVLPRSTKMPDGTFLMTSGRPGVYIRACFDGKGKEWGEVIHIVKVPEAEKYTAYEQYTCCNNGICAYDEKTAFLTYSDFQLNTPEGVRAKSIVVRKITIDEE